MPDVGRKAVVARRPMKVAKAFISRPWRKLDDSNIRLTNR
jgi:hypothetical protein